MNKSFILRLRYWYLNFIMQMILVKQKKRSPQEATIIKEDSHFNLFMKMCFPFFLLYLDTFSIKQKRRRRRPRTFCNFFNCFSLHKKLSLRRLYSCKRYEKKIASWSESCKKQQTLIVSVRVIRELKVFYRFEKVNLKGTWKELKMPKPFRNNRNFYSIFFLLHFRQILFTSKFYIFNTEDTKTKNFRFLTASILHVNIPFCGLLI